jgi:tetratricopeptide (TPR) repeat protein
MLSGGATQTHDHPNNKNQDDPMLLGVDANNDSQHSLGYKYAESGIQFRLVGNLMAAISSFQKAVEAYKVHLVNYEDDTTAQDQLADTLYQLAETLSLMPTADFDQSQPYYQQALDLYAKLPGKSAKLRWAYCLARLGVLMIEQHSGNLPQQVHELLQQRVHGDDYNEDDAMEEVMSRIDVSIPKQAVMHFEDAANVFRSNLDAEGSSRCWRRRYKTWPWQ